jgi:hypothetical protein
MGASGSKATRAAGAASRQYPKGPKGPRPPTSTPQSNPTAQTNPTTNAAPPSPPAPNHSAGPTVKPQPRAAATRSEAINLDASDPDFARSLRSLGPVQPNPTLSPSSAFGQPSSTTGVAAPDPRKNPAIAVLHARARLQEKAEVEERLGRGSKQREFLDVFEMRQALLMRDAQGKTPAQIERRLGLKEGVVARLGGKGVLSVVDEQGRERKEVDIV